MSRWRADDEMNARLFRLAFAEQAAGHRPERVSRPPHLIVRPPRLNANVDALRAKLFQFVQKRVKACKSCTDDFAIVKRQPERRSHSRRHQCVKRSGIRREPPAHDLYDATQHTRCQSKSDISTLTCWPVVVYSAQCLARLAPMVLCDWHGRPMGREMSEL